MAHEVNNYARFYTLLNRVAYAGDREELKKSLVLQYTLNRTDSLREMTAEEYAGCCATLEKITGYRDEQKKLRSRVLKQMQQMGIYTTDWTRVNAFCADARISGKVFRQLTNGDLEKLSVKLRSIAHRGGLKPKAKQTEPHHVTDYVVITPTAEA